MVSRTQSRAYLSKTLEDVDREFEEGKQAFVGLRGAN